MNEGNERQQSEFNMAFSYLNRMNVLFYNANQAAIELDMYAWFHSLRALFRELSTEMKDPEITYWEGEYGEKEVMTANGNVKIIPVKICQGEIDHINGMLSKQIKNTTAGINVNPELYDALNMFEMFLRGVLKESGLQTRMQEAAERALR